MTEQEWLASDDPAAMLATLERWREHHPGFYAISDRKLRLFACAVARHNGHDSLSVSQVEECVEVGQPNHNFNDQDAVDRGQFWRLTTSARAAHGAVHANPVASTAALLREVVGNPFRRVKLPRGEPQLIVVSAIADPEYLGHSTIWTPGACPWLTPDVLAMARCAYEERDFAVLPIIADALEEAGCTDSRVLDHLRSPQKVPCPRCKGYSVGKLVRCDVCDNRGLVLVPHVRGCWSVDLVLGKN